MGSSSSVTVNPSSLHDIKVGTVRREPSITSAPYDLYLSKSKPGKDGNEAYDKLFTLPAGIFIPEVTEVDMPCDVLIDMKSFIAVRRSEDCNERLPHQESSSTVLTEQDKNVEMTPEEMRLVISHCDIDKKVIKHTMLYFDNQDEFIKTEAKLLAINRIRGRKLAVLVNPVSGKKRARGYFRDYLSPMLEISGLKYTKFETESETYVEEWVNSFKPGEFPFTDIICVGGDGLFSQLLNSFGNHPDRPELFKKSIGMLPCGSQNAVACDLGGRKVCRACINVLRGQTTSADIMRVQFKDLNRVLYATSLLWGITGDIVHDAENWRKCFGSARYCVCGTKRFLCACKIKEYNCKIDYKNDSDALHKCASMSLPFKPEIEESKNDPCVNFDSEEEDNHNSVDFNLNSSYCDFGDYNKGVWKNYPTSNFFFYCVITHEARNSLHKNEIFMPQARFNDGKMYLGSLSRMSKTSVLCFLNRFSSARHVDMDQFHCEEVTEVRLTPMVNSFFNIDGEIFPNDELYVRLLPSYINLIGSMYSENEEI